MHDASHCPKEIDVIILVTFNSKLRSFEFIDESVSLNPVPIYVRNAFKKVFDLGKFELMFHHSLIL